MNEPHPHRPPPPPPRGGSGLAIFFTLSLLLNGFLICAGLVAIPVALLIGSASGDSSTSSPQEKWYAGDTGATDKIAVIRLDGVILEGMLGFVNKQIDAAAKDKHVHAVVLRVNSPGGSITASDDLHRKLVKLRDGDPDKKTSPKKLVVSMASMAASGGYYVAMPAETLVAERTTITGSIGVYAALPNIAELANKYGVKMEVIKRGEVKDSGSMFKEMTPQERQVWQDMIDSAYDRFLAVVEEGRPKLKGKLREPVIDRKIKVQDADGHEKEVTYVRRRADGGIFTSEQALKFGLIDQIGYLEDAIQAAHKAAGLGASYKVITYEKPWSFAEALTGIETKQTTGLLDPGNLAAATAPRIWYLAPGSELSGFLTAAHRE